MASLNRRNFIKGTIAAGAAFTISGTKSSGRVLGANDAIRVAVAGLNGRGRSHVSDLAGIEGARVTHLIDPDARTFSRCVKIIESEGGAAPVTVQDAREVLENKDVDVLTIATPNHWHALLTVWGCQAGKDVYVEKPCSHNVREGRIAVEAARKHNRIVQHGTQGRSSRSWARVMNVIRSGELGKLKVARALCYKPRGSIGFKPIKEPPPEVNFDLWLGPAPKQPYHENLVHYNWHWFWDTGSGDIGNQGVHQMDIARWGVGAGLPKSVIGLGGRFGYRDQGETANTQITVFDYGESQLIFEVRGLPAEEFHGQKVGNIFHLEEGTIVGTTFYPKGASEAAPLPEADDSRGPGGNHFANFLAAVRSRKQEDLNADILEGHLSSALCHLANISYRLGSEVPFRPRTEALGDNPDAYETLERMEEHLSGQGLKLEEMACRVGRKLSLDVQNESFVDDSQADAMLTREYRKPFAMPEVV